MLSSTWLILRQIDITIKVKRNTSRLLCLNGVPWRVSWVEICGALSYCRSELFFVHGLEALHNLVNLLVF